MVNIEQTQDLIKRMRQQARALETTAQGLETLIAPLVAAQQSLQSAHQAIQEWINWWTTPR